MKTSESLYAAADYLRRYGWTQFTFGTHGLARCMDGALISVLGSGFTSVDHFLERVCGCTSMEFNDDHCKTADDAIAALEIAAAIAFEEGK